MNNLLSYCELVDARINASENDLPVPFSKADQILKMTIIFPQNDNFSTRAILSGNT